NIAKPPKQSSRGGFLRLPSENHPEPYPNLPLSSFSHASHRPPLQSTPKNPCWSKRNYPASGYLSSGPHFAACLRCLNSGLPAQEHRLHPFIVEACASIGTALHALTKQAEGENTMIGSFKSGRLRQLLVVLVVGILCTSGLASNATAQRRRAVATTIDAGTNITVRTNQTIKTNNANGQVYTGFVDQDVVGTNGVV